MKKLQIVILLNIALLLTACGNNETDSGSEFLGSSVADSDISTTDKPTTEPITQPETEPPAEVKFTLSENFGDTIVDKVYLTMPKNKLFSITGEDYNNTFCWGEGLDTYYTFYIDSFKKLGIEVEASANFGFDENNELHSFYYSIGYDRNDNCIYSADEITNIYNMAFEKITEKYGEYYGGGEHLIDSEGNIMQSLNMYTWFTDYGVLILQGNNINDNNHISIQWDSDDERYEYYNGERKHQKYVSFCHKDESCPNLSPCRVHREKGAYENKSDGIIGDNDGNGVIDESDWEEEWENYLNDKLSDY